MPPPPGPWAPGPQWGGIYPVYLGAKLNIFTLMSWEWNIRIFIRIFFGLRPRNLSRVSRMGDPNSNSNKPNNPKIYAKICRKCTEKYAQTHSRPPGARQGDAFGPQAPIWGGYGFGYIFLCISCIFWGIFWGVFIKECGNLFPYHRKLQSQPGQLPGIFHRKTKVNI